MEYPLVTFLSPCYNHSMFVIESLDSIKKQTYPNIQHIIIDDCSKDDSVYKIEKWIEENEYKCHFIKHSVNKGISYSLNESIELSDGKYWSPLATDDVITLDRTQVFVDYLEKHTDTNMVTSDCKYINEKSQEIFVNGTPSFLQNCTQYRELFSIQSDFGSYLSLFENNYIPSSIMLRTNVFSKVGLFDTNLKIEDWDMWLKVAQLGKIGFIDKYLTLYRYHLNNSISGIELRRFEEESLRIFLKQYSYCKENGLLNEYYTYYEKYFSKLVNFKQNRSFIKIFMNDGPKAIFLKLMTKKLLKKVQA